NKPGQAGFRFGLPPLRTVSHLQPACKGQEIAAAKIGQQRKFATRCFDCGRATLERFESMEEVKDVGSTSFGLVIAFLLPGFAGMFAISFVAPPVADLFSRFIE